MEKTANYQAQIGIVNYGAGNIFSLCAALERLKISFGMINTPDDFEKYEKIIIPGVGHAGAAMQKLKTSGLVEKIKSSSKPTLGICVGMQLLSDFSEEGNVDLLQIIPLQTKKFPENKGVKIPHIGWNTVNHPQKGIFENIAQNAYFYFVHSYFLEYQEMYNLASCKYALSFSAAIGKNNFIGVQFHPEKSGKNGEQLLLNFSKI